MFLTTNRVGTFDEAFKSRIHVSFYYPPLTEQQTFGIYRVNIRKLRKLEQERRKALEAENKPYTELAINGFAIEQFATQHYRTCRLDDGRDVRPLELWGAVAAAGC